MYFQCQDVYLWGPPCVPYTRLSSKRKKADYNPVGCGDALPFVYGSRHISILAAKHGIETLLTLLYAGQVTASSFVSGKAQPKIAIMEEAPLPVPETP